MRGSPRSDSWQEVIPNTEDRQRTAEHCSLLRKHRDLIGLNAALAHMTLARMLPLQRARWMTSQAGDKY